MTTARDLLHGLVLESGQRWGEAATDVQREDASAVLDEHSATPYHWLGRARGFSKTSDLAGIAIAVLLAQAPPRARLYGIAADQPQGALLLDALGGFMQRTPELQGALSLREFKVLAPRSGATLQILPADSAGVWGARPYFVVADEVTQWHDTPRSRRVWEGVTTGLAKVEGSRLAALGTAGDPGHFSYEIRNQALGDPIWNVHEADGPAPWMSKERLAAEKRRLPESSYARLFENRWVTSEDSLADADDIDACLTLEEWPLDPRPGTKYAIGVDIGLRNDRTVAAVMHAEPLPGSAHPRVVLDRLGVWEGTRLRPVRLAEVEAWVERAAREYYRARIRLDPWQGVQLAQGLRRRGLTVDEVVFSPTSIGRMASLLFQAIKQRAIAFPDDSELVNELRNAKLVERSPGLFRLDHPRHGHDDRVVAIALATAFLVQRGAPARARTWSSFQHSARGLSGMERQAALGVGRPSWRGVAAEDAALERRLLERASRHMGRRF